MFLVTSDPEVGVRPSSHKELEIEMMMRGEQQQEGDKNGKIHGYSKT